MNDDYILILQDVEVPFENGEVGRFRRGELVRCRLEERPYDLVACINYG